MVVASRAPSRHFDKILTYFHLSAIAMKDQIGALCQSEPANEREITKAAMVLLWNERNKAGHANADQRSNDPTKLLQSLHILLQCQAIRSCDIREVRRSTIVTIYLSRRGLLVLIY